ncbi:MAG: hypothetical protein QOG15_2435 [Solirubrobacteraceae bacterium]|jgi:hypothetical protein|nr:hypothetical protein [Solirubrobacteraceae bacterium]
MAQTKKKRRSKHRGNAAGVVEARGRTGRKPTEAERKTADRDAARSDRLNREPSWKAAANRAALAAIVFGVLLVLAFKQPVAQAAGLTGFVFLFYIPLGYYTDVFLYKRRKRPGAPAKEKRES